MGIAHFGAICSGHGILFNIPVCVHREISTDLEDCDTDGNSRKNSAHFSQGFQSFETRSGDIDS